MRDNWGNEILFGQLRIWPCGHETPCGKDTCWCGTRFIVGKFVDGRFWGKFEKVPNEEDPLLVEEYEDYVKINNDRCLRRSKLVKDEG